MATRRKITRVEVSADRGVFMISVAAELAEMHPQTLRMYEARGLIEPKRSPKGTRLYSQRDVDMLRRIQEMTSDLGLNLAGVERVLELEQQLERATAAARGPRGALGGDARRRWSARSRRCATRSAPSSCPTAAPRTSSRRRRPDARSGDRARVGRSSSSPVLDVHGLRFDVDGWPEVVEEVVRDFLWFETGTPGRPTSRCVLEHGAPRWDAYGDLTAAFITPRNVVYQNGSRTILDYFGRASAELDRAAGRIVIRSEHPHLAHEAAVPVPALAHRRAPRRPRCRGCMRWRWPGLAAPSACCCHRAAARARWRSPRWATTRDRILAEDTPLLDARGYVHPFPLRIGVNPTDAERMPPGAVRRIERMEFHDKLVLDLDGFRDRVEGEAAADGRPRRSVSGRWRAMATSSACPRRAAAGALLREGVVGVGVYQGMEFVLQRGMRDVAGKAGEALTRARCCAAAARRARVWRLVLGRDHASNLGRPVPAALGVVASTWARSVAAASRSATNVGPQRRNSYDVRGPRSAPSHPVLHARTSPAHRKRPNRAHTQLGQRVNIQRSRCCRESRRRRRRLALGLLAAGVVGRRSTGEISSWASGVSPRSVSGSGVAGPSGSRFVAGQASCSVMHWRTPCDSPDNVPQSKSNRLRFLRGSMNADRFTIKSQEALQAAISLAAGAQARAGPARAPARRAARAGTTA